MYHFRYYAIGHSYLLHGPFPGWQTEGFWGMAASEPSRDYFHRFQDGLKETFDCHIDAIAQNYATYERHCVLGATKESYISSPEYAQMKEVLTTFKPNLISLFIGDGNTVAKDEESAALFYNTLYEMVAANKRDDAIVVCICFRKKICNQMRSFAQKYGFAAVDASFIHENKERDNPYYAFCDYPEYDEARANGAVEFRTHPNNLGHDAIAKAMLAAVRDAIPQKIPKGVFDEPYEFEQYVAPTMLPKFRIATEPELFVSFHGFNVRQEGDCVTFGSAPETGASVAVDGLHISPESKRFYIELAVRGVEKQERLRVIVSTKTEKIELSCALSDEAMHRYEFDLSEIGQPFHAIRVSPTLIDCVLTVKALGFQ